MSLATPESAPQPAVVVPTVTPVSPCLVYSWCTLPGQHDDHMGASVTVPSAKADEPDYLDAYLLHCSGSRPIIGVGGADLNAGQARMEAAKLRAFAAHSWRPSRRCWTPRASPWTVPDE